MVPDGDVGALARAVDVDHADGAVRSVPDLRARLASSAAHLIGGAVRGVVEARG